MEVICIQGKMEAKKKKKTVNNWHVTLNQSNSHQQTTPPLQPKTSRPRENNLQHIVFTEDLVEMCLKIHIFLEFYKCFNFSRFLVDPNTINISKK